MRTLSLVETFASTPPSARLAFGVGSGSWTSPPPRTSPATVSRIERGLLDGLALGTLRRLSQALEIRIELLPRSRGADLDRMVRARHAALAEDVLAWLRGFGWEVRPEVSFAHFGERGVVFFSNSRQRNVRSSFAPSPRVQRPRRSTS